MKLHLGCGLKYKEGWVNLDFNKEFKADVYHNLEKYPYPFKDNSVDEILMESVLEHLEDTIKVMEELNRICKKGAIIHIITPHFQGIGVWTHITHKRAFGIGTFNTFEPQSIEKYSKAEFKVLEEKIIWFNFRHYWWLKPFKVVANYIININPLFSQRFLWVLFAGFDTIEYKLEVIK